METEDRKELRSRIRFLLDRVDQVDAMADTLWWHASTIRQELRNLYEDLKDE